MNCTYSFVQVVYPCGCRWRKKGRRVHKQTTEPVKPSGKLLHLRCKFMDCLELVRRCLKPPIPPTEKDLLERTKQILVVPHWGLRFFPMHHIPGFLPHCPVQYSIFFDPIETKPLSKSSTVQIISDRDRCGEAKENFKDRHAELPFILMERLYLPKVFAASNVTVKPSIDDDANTIDLAINSLPGPTFLHLACHGASDYLKLGGYQEMRSALAGSPVPTHSDIKGVFIDACFAGFTQGSEFDDTQSIPTAFLSSGVDCVIAAMLMSPDPPAPFQTSQFYKLLLSSVSSIDQ